MNMICEDCNNCKYLAYLEDEDGLILDCNSFIFMNTSFRWCLGKKAPTTFDTCADFCNWFVEK